MCALKYMSNSQLVSSGSPSRNETENPLWPPWQMRPRNHPLSDKGQILNKMKKARDQMYTHCYHQHIMQTKLNTPGFPFHDSIVRKLVCKGLHVYQYPHEVRENPLIVYSNVFDETSWLCGRRFSVTRGLNTRNCSMNVTFTFQVSGLITIWYT